MLTSLPADVVEEFMYQKRGVGVDGFIYHCNQDISEHRWYMAEWIIFEHEGQLYGADYMDPASESQDGQDRFDADLDDNIDVFPVKAATKTITIYEKDSGVPASS